MGHSAFEFGGDYRLILDSIPHLVWVAAADGGTEYLNQPFLQFTGMPMKELLGWDWKQLIHPDDFPQTLAAWKQALKTGTVLESECRMRRADGEFRWFVNRAKPVRNAAGTVGRWFGTCTDVTDSKKAEAARQATEGLFRAIVERSEEGFALLTTDFKLQYVSPAIKRILGYHPEAIVGVCIHDLVHADDLPGWKTWLEYLLSQPGERIEVWYRFRNRDNVYQRIEVRATNLLDDPNVKAIVLNFWSVSDVKSARKG